MPIDRRMNKEVMVHIYSGIVLSHKKERSWFIHREVDGPRYCNRVKQVRKKNKYRILMHIHGIQKNGTEEPFARHK